MNTFSISDIQKYTGVKAHTIRVWEKRYNVLSPYRSEGNTRNYSGNDLRRLLNIISLMDEDYKISELCSMQDNKLNELLSLKFNNSSVKNSNYDYFISQIISSALMYNEEQFEKFFSNAVIKYGLIETYSKIIYPFLVRTGLMWSKDGISPANEHFITCLIQQKFYSIIDSLPPAINHNDSWLLFLPENEFHEVGLLFANLLLRKAGKKVFYLGGNVPQNSLQSAVKELNPANVLTFFVAKNDSDNNIELVNEFKKDFKKQNIYVAFDILKLKNFKAEKNIFPINSIEDLEKAVKKIK